MVVEQRIGRIDTIGQQAKRPVILNFIVENSIEERVLKRLLTKIESFKSIGEPDPIIGEEPRPQQTQLERENRAGNRAHCGKNRRSLDSSLCEFHDWSAFW
jgi:SNF2 family DNA or RNA helicase